MKPRTPLPDSIASGPFSVREGAAAGLGASRMRGADLSQPFWGVRVPGDPNTDLRARCAAYLRRAHPSAFFSHVTAARLWGIRVPYRLEGRVELDVAVPFPKRAPMAHGVLAHKLDVGPSDIIVRDGMPCTSPARTVCDLANILSPEELLAAADSVIWRRAPLSTVHHLELAAANRRGRGRIALALVVPLVSERADSAPESILRWRIIRSGLPAPSVNSDIRDQNGRFLALPDLSFVDYLMAIDYEGDHHRVDAAQWQKDIARVPRLQDAGWHHTRASALDLRDSAKLLDRLARLLRQRGWRG